jgi:hypothetical protein
MAINWSFTLSCLLLELGNWISGPFLRLCAVLSNKKKPRKMRSIQTILISAALLHSASSSPNCDTAIEGGLCPDAFSLDELGACLSSKKAELDDNCALFVEVEKYKIHLFPVVLIILF